MSRKEFVGWVSWSENIHSECRCHHRMAWGCRRNKHRTAHHLHLSLSLLPGTDAVWPVAACSCCRTTPDGLSPGTVDQSKPFFPSTALAGYFAAGVRSETNLRLCDLSTSVCLIPRAGLPCDSRMVNACRTAELFPACTGSLRTAGLSFCSQMGDATSSPWRLNVM